MFEKKPVGRPKNKTTTKTVALYVQIPEDLADRLHRFGASKTFVVREAIKEYLDRKEP